MENKRCSKCGKVKGLDEFVKNSRNKDGFASLCKECKKRHYEENKEKILEKQKEHYDNNKEIYKEKNKEFYKENKEKIDQKNKEYAEKYPEKIKAIKKRYRDNNIEKINKKNKEYRENNREEINRRSREYNKTKKRKEYMREYAEKNREQLRENKREYAKRRYKEDIFFRIHTVFSSLLRQSLYGAGGKNGNSAFDILPYTKEDLMRHLEEKFREGMSWENYGKGGWVIDHIIPRSSFQFSSYEDKGFQRCWALENLQPLWEKENIKKGNKILFIGDSNGFNPL